MSDKILVIDDEESIRKSFTLALEESAYRVDTAESGEVGIEMERENDYSLIFLDLKMPGLNGVQTLKQIRKQNREVPVYIVTAFHREYLDELRAASANGIEFDLIQKPIGSSEITTVVEGVLSQVN